MIKYLLMFMLSLGSLSVFSDHHEGKKCKRKKECTSKYNEADWKELEYDKGNMISFEGVHTTGSLFYWDNDKGDDTADKEFDLAVSYARRLGGRWQMKYYGQWYEGRQKEGQSLDVTRRKYTFLIGPIYNFYVSQKRRTLNRAWYTSFMIGAGYSKYDPQGGAGFGPSESATYLSWRLELGKRWPLREYFTWSPSIMLLQDGDDTYGEDNEINWALNILKFDIFF